MSMVIATSDKYKKLRDKSKEQESKISKDAMFVKWQISDISKSSPFLKLIGLVSIPIVAFWALLLGSVGLVISGFIYALKLLSKIFK